MYLDKDNILLHLYNFISIHNNHECHPQNISFPLYCKTYLINISPTGIVTLVRGTQKVNPMTLSDSKLVIKQSPPWVLRGFPATCRPKHESRSLKTHDILHDYTWYYMIKTIRILISTQCCKYKFTKQSRTLKRSCCTNQLTNVRHSIWLRTLVLAFLQEAGNSIYLSVCWENNHYMRFTKKQEW